MPSITPTDEQLAVIDHIARGKPSNLLVSARAGSAKTSTIVMGVQAQPDINALCLAFNKAIAQEMQAKFKGIGATRAQARTMNSIGHRAWGRAVGKRLTLDSGKTRRLLKAYIDSCPERVRDELWDTFALLRQTIDMAKQWGWVPSEALRLDGPRLAPILDDEEFFEMPDFTPSAAEMQAMTRVLTQSIEESLAGTIDFGDQVYMPAIAERISLESAPHLLVDEAQDLSALNHVLIAKMAGPLRSRIIAVGDPCQAIYAFRGADGNSMPNMRALFQMEELKLTTCFRCPTAVVQEALWRAPDMRSPSWMAKGTVQALSEWDIAALPPGSAIICRNNAPLFAVAIKALTAGVRVTMKQGDVAKLIKARLEKFAGAKKQMDMPQSILLDKIRQWGQAEQTRSRDERKTQDTIDCLEILATQGDTLGDALAYCDYILAQEGSIHLMTGHRAKGLEYKDVYFLDEHLCKREGQDRNIKYVIQTRATENLTYITTDGLI